MDPRRAALHPRPRAIPTLAELRARRAPVGNEMSLLAHILLVGRVKSVVTVLFSLLLCTVSMNCMTEDAKKTKARQDLDTLAQAIDKFREIEDRELASLLDLKGRYLTNIDTLRDPWGEPYRVDLGRGVAFSSGPDTAHDPLDRRAEMNADDIGVPYIHPPELLRARIVVERGGFLGAAAFGAGADDGTTVRARGRR